MSVTGPWNLLCISLYPSQLCHPAEHSTICSILMLLPLPSSPLRSGRGCAFVSFETARSYASALKESSLRLGKAASASKLSSPARSLMIRARFSTVAPFSFAALILLGSTPIPARRYSVHGWRKMVVTSFCENESHTYEFRLTRVLAELLFDVGAERREHLFYE